MTACTININRHSDTARESAQNYIRDNEDKFVDDMANYLVTQHFTLNQIGVSAMRDIIEQALADGEMSPQPGPSHLPPFNSVGIATAPTWRIGPGWNVLIATSLIFSSPDPNPDNPSPRFRTRLHHNVLVDTDTGEIISATLDRSKRFVWVTYSQDEDPPRYSAHNR